jgi:hypothetical protein
MTCVMCSPWKRTFTLAPLVPLTMISPHDKGHWNDVGVIMKQTLRTEQI